PQMASANDKGSAPNNRVPPLPSSDESHWTSPPTGQHSQTPGKPRSIDKVQNSKPDAPRARVCAAGARPSPGAADHHCGRLGRPSNPGLLRNAAPAPGEGRPRGAASSALPPIPPLPKKTTNTPPPDFPPPASPPKTTNRRPPPASSAGKAATAVPG